MPRTEPVTGNMQERMQSVRQNAGAWFSTVLTGAIAVWAFHGLQFNFSHLSTGIARQSSQLVHLFPLNRGDWFYDLALMRTLWDPLQATMQMAIVGTVVGALLAFPVSFAAARTGYFPRPISNLVKTLLNVARAVPTLVYALVAVSLVGLGSPAGASAIAFVTFISLGKLYAEGLESVAPGPIEAVRAAGGNSVQVFIFAMLPQVLPLYLSTMLYSLEYNIKDSFIVGIVGAGGLGFSLQNAINLYKWQDAGVIIFFLVVLVNLVDYISYRVRKSFS
ncbi:MAG: phosphonate ABC transporter, permease protein PhnE [Capsulimonadaceae bacterium]|nr:phosphonate ABC transporter, permease protein PhnE [Capsulimonadaceae bacterium]